jgi:transposase
MMTMTRTNESTAPTITSPINLLLAFELGERVWKLGFTTGVGQRPRIRQIAAGAVDRLVEEIARAKGRLRLAADVPVVSCYEAGRDGFWLHRYLVAHGITNHVVDSSSIEVNRRARRAKTDRLDLAGLLTLLARYLQGDRRTWRVVRVPSVSEEDARHLHRAWTTVQQDRTRLINRLKGLLTSVGVRLRLDGDFERRLATARLWDETPVPDGMRQRLTRVWTQLEFLNGQLEELEAARTALAPVRETTTGRYVAALPTLRGIGPIGAWVLATEIFGWREIRNGRQLGALVGLVPAPFQSGETSHDQGITRAGNKHVRRLMVQLAWSWLRYQPTSALSRWYHERFGGGGKRMRRIGIVALARKLLIALWRYVDTGTVPEGAQLKASAV